jgi:hypothetical protein
MSLGPAVTRCASGFDWQNARRPAREARFSWLRHGLVVNLTLNLSPAIANQPNKEEARQEDNI